MSARFDVGPLFIVGVPRSGTTLLQRMFDAHPEIAIAPETFFVRRFAERRKHYGALGTAAHREKLVRDLVATPEFAEMGLDPREFAAAVNGAGPGLEYGDVFGELLDRYRVRRGKSIVGEKTPNHLLAMRRIEQWFPNARFVHIVRDPRAVTESWRNVPWTNGSLTKDAEVWRRYLATSRVERPLRAAYHEIRYEALVESPARELSALCAAIGVRYDERMTRYHETAPESLDVGREPWKADALKPPSREGVGRFADRLSPAEIAEIESVAYFEMRRAGYAPRTPLARLLPAAIAGALERRRARRRRDDRGRREGRSTGGDGRTAASDESGAESDGPNGSG